MRPLKDYFNIKYIFFDVVGTLLFPEPSASRIYYDVGKRYGSRLTIDEVRARFRRALEQQDHLDEQAGWRTDEDREHQRWRDIVTEVLDDVDNQPGCFETLYQHFAQPGAWRSADEAETVFSQLRDRGFELGLATNFDKRLRSLLKQFSLFQKVRHIAISSEIGWRKPAERFFQTIVETTKSPPSQILLVGDDFHNDYQGGSAAGLRTVHLQLDDSEQTIDGATIASLSEIVELSVDWKSEE